MVRTRPFSPFLSPLLLDARFQAAATTDGAGAPTEAQPIKRQANAPGADLDPMDLLEMMLDQRDCPSGRVIAEPAGIEIDDLGNQWIDDPQSGGRTPLPWRIGQTSTEVEAVPVLESIDPVVNSLAIDVQQFGDLLHRFALIKPEYGLGTATLRSKGEPGRTLTNGSKTINWVAANGLTLKGFVVA